MANRQVNESVLAIGGILAGWEIDPGWVPRAGDTITLEFGSGYGGQFPETTTVTIAPVHVLAAMGMRAGGRGLSQAMQAAATKASESWKPGPGPGPGTGAAR